QNSNKLMKVGPVCPGATDSHGLLICEAPAPVSGNIIVQASAADKQGKETVANTDIWVADGDDWWFSSENNDRMDLLPAKKNYEPGETASFQVRMPFKEATALVTVEREGVLDTYVQTLSRKKPLVSIPVKGNYSPNVFVSVLAVRGRVGDIQSTALVDLGRPAYKMGIAEINVGWQAHQLKVKVNPQNKIYKIREKARAVISVSSEDGKPLPSGGEVAVAVVDEGLLELMPNTSWKLLEAMMGRRSNSVETATAQMQVVGKRHYGLKALPQGGGGGRTTTRELFDTLLLWKAILPLNAQGKAEVEIPLNDSITSFKIAAIATAGPDKFGTGASSIRTTQDLSIFSGLAPVVREGDKYRAYFTVRNSSAQTSTVSLSSE
ncbi:MAG TPA: alpha-2-macroglobulin family protein, partial [Elusimicrobiales bacterium]|nr:alpha-2-macroglobulin family protein [Elusimicrobiales bacterium]